MAETWNLEEAVLYYRKQGAPADQQMLAALLREVQDASGGVLPAPLLTEIASAYGLTESFLSALIRRIPSLRTQEAPHSLVLCGGASCSRSGASKLAAFVERTYQVKPGGVSKTGRFSYRVAACMKACRQGPSLMWDGRLYSGADEALLCRLIDGTP